MKGIKFAQDAPKYLRQTRRRPPACPRRATLAAYRWSDLHSLDFGFGFPTYLQQRDHQTSVEIRLAGPRERMLSWLVGGYYYDEGIATNYQFNASVADGFQSFGIGTKSEAGFGRLTLSPIESLRFVGGAVCLNPHRRE